MATFIKTVFATDLETGESWIHEQVEVDLPGASGFAYTEDGIYYEGIFQTPKEFELDSFDPDSDLYDPSFSLEDMEGY